MTDRLWVLGAADPEMAAIEQLLTECGERFAIAVGADGQRVIPRTAYEAVGAVMPDGSPVDPASITHVVECSVFGAEHATVIDHHRPGDPGYGRPPEEFLSASSIGQVVQHLALAGHPFCRRTPTGGETGWPQCHGTGGAVGDLIFAHSAADPFSGLKPRRGDRWHVVKDASTRHFVETGTRLSSDERRYESVGYVETNQRAIAVAIDGGIVLAAAADHCLAAAYRGECPGVDPDALMRWRAETRAAFQGRSAEAILADVGAARKRLRDTLSGEYADLRGESIPELPEAAAREGIPFLASVKERDGREKVVLGAAPPELVERFLRGELVPGLTERYGDPARGFAGGYPAASAASASGLL